MFLEEQRPFAKLENLDPMVNEMSRLIVESSDQQLAKCLFYDYSDALTRADLTDEQKLSLFRGEQPRILNIDPLYYITDQSRTELRIYEVEISGAVDRYIANVHYGFDILVHYSLYNLADGRRRMSVMLTSLLNILNDKNVKGLGTLLFDMTPLAMLVPYSKEFLGYHLSATARSTSL